MLYDKPDGLSDSTGRHVWGVSEKYGAVVLDLGELVIVEVVWEVFGEGLAPLLKHSIDLVDGQAEICCLESWGQVTAQQGMVVDSPVEIVALKKHVNQFYSVDFSQSKIDVKSVFLSQPR